MLRIFVFLMLFISYIYSSEYPQIFSQMGTPLYKSNKAIEKLSDIKELKKLSFEFDVMAKKTKELGFLADNSDDDKQKKKYLFELRQLQKKYDLILHQIHKNIDKAIKKNDYKLFYRCLGYDFDGLLKSRTLQRRAIEFYKKDKNKKSNAILDNKIEFKKNVVYNQSEMYLDVKTSTYTSSTTAPSGKKVYISSKKEKNYIDIFVHNTNTFSISVFINSEFKNVKYSDVKNSFAMGANSKVRYARVYKKHGRGSYRLSYSWMRGSMDAVHDDSYVYRLPFTQAKSYLLTQGYNGKYTHKGANKYALDFAMKIGTKVCAARDGIVVQVKEDSNKVGYALKYAKYGNFVTIEHSDGTLSTYYHLKKGGAIVQVGQRVQRGEVIGYSGNTGYSSGPHLHFQVYKVLPSKSIASIPVKFATASGTKSNLQVGRYYRVK